MKFLGIQEIITIFIALAVVGFAAWCIMDFYQRCDGYVVKGPFGLVCIERER